MTTLHSMTGWGTSKMSKSVLATANFTAHVLWGPLSRIDQLVISHRAFAEALRALRRAVHARRARMVLVCGVSGAGKGVLADTIIAEMRARMHVEPHELVAACVQAPEPQGRAPFSWSTLWKRILRALNDPLPDHKISYRPSNHGMVKAASRPASQDDLRDSVIDAVLDRGLRVLVIDEALGIVRASSGPSITEQLHVLRGLVDAVGCTLVLLSTPRILEFIDVKSEQLLRRLVRVEIHRYRARTENHTADFPFFGSVVKHFMHELPAEARPRFTRGQLDDLFSCSVGCIGHLSDWVCRALTQAIDEGGDILEWRHFEDTVLDDKDLKLAYEAACSGEAYLRDPLRVRACGRLLWHEGAVAQGQAAPGAEVEVHSAMVLPDAQREVKRSRRVGVPGATRHEVPT